MFKSTIGLILLVINLRAEFVRDDDLEVVVDTINKLMWQDNYDTVSLVGDWSNAVSYCKRLNFAGYSDWFLPSYTTIHNTINTKSKYNTFKYMKESYYWTVNEGWNKDIAYAMKYFVGREIFVKTDYHYVRCLRRYSYYEINSCQNDEKVTDNGVCVPKTCEIDNYNCPICLPGEVLKYNADGSGYCEVVEKNNPPEILSTFDEILVEKSYQFSGLDFKRNYTDQDGDELVKIKITYMPQNGILSLTNHSSSTVVLDQEILVDDLKYLYYIVNDDYEDGYFSYKYDPFADDGFRWKAYDGRDWSNEADMTFNIIESRKDCDISSNQAKILPADSYGILDGCDFKDSYDVSDEIWFVFKYNMNGKIYELPTVNSCKVSDSKLLNYSKTKARITFEENGMGTLTCVYNNIVVRETIKVGEVETYPNSAIIVVGKGSDSDKLKNAFEYLGNSVYQFLYSQGYSDDEIEYFNAFGKQKLIDKDLDGKKDNVVDYVSFDFDDIKEAINKAPQSKNPLLIYLIDHGTKGGGFIIDSKHKIYATELKKVLDDYQDRVDRDVIVVVDSCYSGAFVDILKGENRVIISSGTKDELVQMSTNGISFTNYFVKSLSNKKSIKDSFNEASKTYTNIVKNSHPQSSFKDSKLSTSSLGIFFYASDGVIKSFTKDLKLSKPQTQKLTLKTSDAIIDKPNAKGYAIITPPQRVVVDPNNDTDAIEIKSTKVAMTYDSTNDIYYTEYSFNKKGVYQIEYEISDIAGDIYRSDTTTIQVGTSTESIVYIENKDDKTVAEFITSKSFTKTGTFTNYDFLGVDKAFDWAFVTNSGAVYQLQGKSPTKSDVFGWKKVDIKPTITSSSWNMIFLDDWDSDGVTKFDWVLYKNENKTDQIYKLGGVSDSGNFVYEKIDGLKALIDINKNSVRFEQISN